jgi:hypothetical protein
MYFYFRHVVLRSECLVVFSLMTMKKYDHESGEKYFYCGLYRYAYVRLHAPADKERAENKKPYFRRVLASLIKKPPG